MTCRTFDHKSNRQGVINLVKRVRPISCIIHTAAQPSHDLAANIPFDDFDTNDLNLLEAARQYLVPNCLSFTCQPIKYMVIYLTSSSSRNWTRAGTMTDLLMRTAYGDIFYRSVQAFPFRCVKWLVTFWCRNTVVMAVYRGLSYRPNHSGVESHGFLSYLIKCNLEGGVQDFWLQRQTGTRQHPFRRRGSFHLCLLSVAEKSIISVVEANSALYLKHSRRKIYRQTPNPFIFRERN